jgi:hydroxysqualene synthase
MNTQAASQVTHGVDHYENFPVASWLTPARLRPAIQAIYWFARTADDIADEGDAAPEQRLADLAAFRADLLICATSDARSSRWPGVFSPLSQAIKHYALPVKLLDDLLQAFEQDVRYNAAQRWYVNNAELLDYCKRSANPVGRLLLHLYGVKGRQELAASDAICSALQLINFWQDLSKDIPRGRYYIPLNALAAHQVPPADVLALKDSAITINLIAACADFARAAMRKGFDLPRQVRSQVQGFEGWRLSMELRCVIQGGLRIHEKIEQLQHRTLSQRPRLSKWDALVIAWRALRM